MVSALRTIWPLMVAILLMSIGNGLQGSLIGVQAAVANFSSTTTGIIASGFSLGLFLSAVFTPNIVRSVGHIRVFAAYASVLSTAVLLIPVYVDPVWWFVMRTLIGFCAAGLAIVVETWLNEGSTNETRGTVLSVYMIIFYTGAGLGSFALLIDDPSGFVRFIVVSAVMSLSLVPIALTRVKAPVLANPMRISIGEIFAASPLAVVAAIANGLGQSAFFNLGAVFGVSHGLSLPYVSTMMAIAPMAVLVSQMPIGWLSDRYDRRVMIVGLSIVSAALAGVAMMMPATTELWLIAVVALFGGISMPLYSLAIAHANDQLSVDQMLAAGSKLVLLYSMGAIAGPSIAGGFMQQLGSAGFMIYMVIIYGGLALYAVYRMTQSTALPPSETGDLVPVAPVATAVAATAVAEEMVETAEQHEDSSQN
ncbi:MAG: MFS transporter [Anderseniella sp.]|nr:MFS transporter [Anderseniella sp.]